MTAAHLAYANARLRARRTRVLRADAILRFVVSESPASTIPGWRDLAPDDAGGAVLDVVFGRLMAEYAFAVRVSPEAAPVLLALVRLHEIENLKVVWRAIARGRAVDEWRSCWRPLGRLESIALEGCQRAASLRALADAVHGSPYGEIAAATLRAHAADVEAADLEFDRWALGQLRMAADRLDRREALARSLVQSVADERALLPAIRAGRALPAQLDVVRAARDRLSARAFRGTPYCLAPLVAYLLSREAEARALISAAEQRARR